VQLSKQNDREIPATPSRELTSAALVLSGPSDDFVPPQAIELTGGHSGYNVLCRKTASVPPTAFRHSDHSPLPQLVLARAKPP
jgi:hypothetical protein